MLGRSSQPEYAKHHDSEAPYKLVFTPFMVAFSFSLIGMTRHFSPLMTCA